MSDNTMNNLHTSNSQRGGSLIEVMITLTVVTVGILAVVLMQTQFSSQSNTSKAKAEAIALAQAHIERIRNYTNSVSSRDDFESYLATTAGYANAAEIDGVNATFKREELISAIDSSREVSVRVSWDDRSGTSQNVELTSRMAWQSPRAPGDTAKDYDTLQNLTPAPTGIALPGKGKVPEEAMPFLVDNSDGTKLYQDGRDLKLVVGDDIVLTLQDACTDTETEQPQCDSFVTINGRVYIDTAEQSLMPGEVAVVASDNSFCIRYYGGDDASGVEVVDNDTTTAAMTTNNDYSYFNYRCYTASGWHGNIGILLAEGISATDKICMGDPTLDINSDNPWEQPVIFARRIYRGMVYKEDPDTESGKEEDENGVPKFWSIGVAKGAEIGYDPETGEPKHNFVITSMKQTETTGDKCISEGAMVRADAEVDGKSGGLFAGVPGDFFCLNPDVDDFTNEYAMDDSCPFDPSGPPIEHYVVSGKISVDLESGPVHYHSNDLSSLVALIDMNTSDGPGNCTLTDFPITEGSSVIEASYKCDVYDWGVGWSGFLQLNANSEHIACSADRFYLDDISSDQAGPDFSCLEGHYAIIRGTIAQLSGAELASVSLREIESDSTGYCNFTDYSYSCITNPFALMEWNGELVFDTTSGHVCETDNGDGVISFLDGEGLSAASKTTKDIVIARNAAKCP